MTKLPDRPSSTRPRIGVRMAGSAAQQYLTILEWLEFDLDCYVALGVISQDEADAVTHRQTTDLSLLGLIPEFSASTWEKLAGWQQRPHRTLDPLSPEYHLALAEQFSVFYGADDVTTRKCLATADEYLHNPPVNPQQVQARQVVVDQGDTNDALSLQSDEEADEATAIGRVRVLTRG